MTLTKENKTKLHCIICGVICALCVCLYTISVKTSAEASRNDALARYGGEQVEVCVAKKDIAAGEKVDNSCIETKLWLVDMLPEDSVRNVNDIIGKQATSSILNGEVVSYKRFQDLAQNLEVPAGLSAVSVPAKDVSAVGGALKAGMYIDVYSTGNISTTLIAHNVMVLATSTSFNESSSSSSVTWITLAVEPASVQELVAASQSSTLYYVLPSEYSTNDEDSNFFNADSVEVPSIKDQSYSGPIAGKDSSSGASKNLSKWSNNE